MSSGDISSKYTLIFERPGACHPECEGDGVFLELREQPKNMMLHLTVYGNAKRASASVGIPFSITSLGSVKRIKFKVYHYSLAIIRAEGVSLTLKLRLKGELIGGRRGLLEEQLNVNSNSDVRLGNIREFVRISDLFITWNVTVDRRQEFNSSEIIAEVWHIIRKIEVTTVWEFRLICDMIPFKARAIYFIFLIIVSLLGFLLARLLRYSIDHRCRTNVVFLLLIILFLTVVFSILFPYVLSIFADEGFKIIEYTNFASIYSSLSLYSIIVIIMLFWAMLSSAILECNYTKVVLITLYVIFSIIITGLYQFTNFHWTNFWLLAAESPIFKRLSMVIIVGYFLIYGFASLLSFDLAFQFFHNRHTIPRSDYLRSTIGLTAWISFLIFIASLVSSVTTGLMPFETVAAIRGRFVPLLRLMFLMSSAIMGLVMVILAISCANEGGEYVWLYRIFSFCFSALFSILAYSLLFNGVVIVAFANTVLLVALSSLILVSVRL